MHVRVRTACLVAAWWFGTATVALAQVPGQAAADSVGRGLTSLRARLDSIEAGACPAGPAIVPINSALWRLAHVWNFALVDSRFACTRS